MMLTPLSVLSLDQGPKWQEPNEQRAPETQSGHRKYSRGRTGHRRPAYGAATASCVTAIPRLS